MKRRTKGNRTGTALGTSLGTGLLGSSSVSTAGHAPSPQGQGQQSKSGVSYAGYRDGNLLVNFPNGSIYEFADVPESVANELKSAESCGSCFNSKIKGKYAGRRV